MKSMKLIVLLAFLLISFKGLEAQNYGLQFNGVNNKVGVNDSPELNPNSAITLEVWINAHQWAGSIWGACLISKQGTNPDKGYGLTVGENGRIEFNHSVNQSWKAVQTPPILGLNTWYHIAAVYDLSTMKLYVNGILQATVDTQGSPTLGTGVTMIIGDNPTWSGRYFKGIMDEIRVWEVARSQEQIQENMSIELNGDEEGLVAYWKMNEGAGSTIFDSTDNENNGTLINMNESNWVDGFAPPGIDMGILGIASPSIVGSGFTSSEYIIVDVKNFAVNDIHEFNISYKINDGETITESFQQTISAFETAIIGFANPVDLTSFSEIELTVWVEAEGDGNTVNDQITTTISQSNTLMLYDKVQHNFSSAGQTHFKTVYMPQDLSGYESIVLNLDLLCPAGGCDPWDQPGMLYIQKDNVAYEILRYITPYGKACGGWSFDLTDFKPILEGKTIFESIIRVWGASGWLVDMELVLTPGTPQYEVLSIDRLWNEDYWVYGDPGISYDFPEITIPIHEHTERVLVRMTVTGHGQGNTLNAAEFSEFTHHVWVAGNESFGMHLWNDDCNQNPCSPQNGTWQYSRAGWCPGQDVQPWFFNLNDLFTPGESISLDFVLADYTNELNSGYNNSSHTEPHYRVHAYLVQYKQSTQYQLNITIEGNGSTTPDAGTHSYTEGSTVALTATPDEGWQFEKWIIDGVDDSDNPTSVVMNGNVDVIAHFTELPQYQLTITVEGNGSVTPSVGTHSYFEGSIVELAATPDEGWFFEKWVIDGINVSDNPASVTMNGNIEVVAHFAEPPQYQLTIAVEGNGSVTPDVGTYSYVEGSIVELVATPDEGWLFEKWEINGSDVAENETTVTMTANVNALAIFVESSNSARLNQKGKAFVYPNPSDGIINIIASDSYIQRIEVFSMEGLMVKSIVGSSTNRVTIDISDKPMGIYIIKVQTSNGVTSQIIVKH